MPPDPAPEPLEPRAGARDGAALWLQATGVALAGRGLLILGAPGSGKSTLALQLMALGAALISDDGLWLRPGADGPALHRPAQAPGLIEARGIGLLQAGPTVASAPLSLVADLDRTEPHRLPPRRAVAAGDRIVPLIHAAGHPSLAPALALMLRHGRAQP
jgi:HPr kinase/phosphorylase